MVSSLLAGINDPILVDRMGLMPQSLTRKKPPPTTTGVAGFKSEWWPDLFRNGGRLQIGILAGFTSEHPAGLNRNPQIRIAGRFLNPRRGAALSIVSMARPGDAIPKERNTMASIRLAQGKRSTCTPQRINSAVSSRGE
jgi:hypothetical protein